MQPPFVSMHTKKFEFLNIAPWAQEKIEVRIARIDLKT